VGKFKFCLSPLVKRYLRVCIARDGTSSIDMLDTSVKEYLKAEFALNTSFCTFVFSRVQIILEQ